MNITWRWHITQKAQARRVSEILPLQSGVLCYKGLSLISYYSIFWWFHPQISLGYPRPVETIITKITTTTKNNYNYTYYV